MLTAHLEQLVRYVMYGISKYLHSLPLSLHLFFECNLLIFTLPSLPPPLLLSLPSPFLSPSLPSSLFPLPPSLPLPSLLPFFSPLFPSSFSLSLSFCPGRFWAPSSNAGWCWYWCHTICFSPQVALLPYHRGRQWACPQKVVFCLDLSRDICLWVVC